MIRPPDTVTVRVVFPPGLVNHPWRLRVSGTGKKTTVERISPDPPAGRGTRRRLVGAEVDGICLSITERMAAGEPLPTGVALGIGLYRAIVEAVRDPVDRRQFWAAN